MRILPHFFPKSCLDYSKKLKFRRVDKYVHIILDKYFISFLKKPKYNVIFNMKLWNTIYIIMKVVNSYCSEKINENKTIPTIATTKKNVEYHFT